MNNSDGDNTTTANILCNAMLCNATLCKAMLGCAVHTMLWNPIVIQYEWQ